MLAEESRRGKSKLYIERRQRQTPTAVAKNNHCASYDQYKYNNLCCMCTPYAHTMMSV